MDILDIFDQKGKLEQMVIPGPSSRRCLPKDMSLLNAQLNTSIYNKKQGTHYAAEYIQKEEERLLESAKNHNINNENIFETVSLGTEPNCDIHNEKTVQIYKTFDCTYHLKSNLIISSRRDQIVSMIETNSVIVIQGPTGCGKTTQVPQFILDSCYKKRQHCNIIVTQPRRIAAISIAKRVCRERDWPVGSLVGYQIGLINHTSNDTRLTFCTTGVLLHKLINAKHMLDYTHVILDEVHERDQDMDFLLLVIRKLLHTNSRSVKVILMSATFEVERFAKYFSSPVQNKLVPAPIIDIPKKTFFNLATFYLCQMGALGPLPEVSESEPYISKKMIEFCVNLIKILDDMDIKADDANYDAEFNFYERHVILVFLPGINEIEELHNILSLPKHEKAKWDIVILHSSVTNEEQQRIFMKPPRGYRRVILSTNIAESSVTVPDVKYVIDFCLTKQIITDPKTNFQCLQLRWASKVNCEQRAGRAGRVMDGRVYRLVPQAFYENVLPQQVEPEMLRAPLENLVLKAKLLNMGEPKAILALSLDPPDLECLEKTILLLKEVGALVNKFNEVQKFDGDLTELGRIMASLPLNVNVSKLIVLGHVFSVLKDAIIIAACLTVKDMFKSPFQQKLLAYNVKLNWADNSCSDCIAFMNAYKVWITEKANCRLRSDSAEKKWASRYFVQLRVLREIKALVTELTARLEKLGIEETAGVNKVVWKEDEAAFILKIVIAGAFYPNYFVQNASQQQYNEHAGVKLLGGLDPSKTVYLQGWPLKQPGPLYASRIQDIFKKNLTNTAGKIKISFDSSSRVYVQFVEELPEKMYRNAARISSSVYKAVKMRQCNIPIEIPLLCADIANQRAEDMNLNRKGYFNSENIINDRIKPELPGLGEVRIPVRVQNIESPGRFWIQIHNASIGERLEKMESMIEYAVRYSKVFTMIPETGTLVIAPYEENNCKVYLRAVVEGHITSPKILVQLFFIDYGYSSECPLSDLKRLEYNSEIANIPALAVECKLANVQPHIAHNFNGEWSQASYEMFSALINKPGKLFGEIYSVVNSVVAIELINKNGKNEININQLLIENRFALKKVEDYFSRFNHNLRKKHCDMSYEQCQHYEKLQYNQDYVTDNYPEAPLKSECFTTLNLRGPFSPLEVELNHLTVAGRNKRINMATNSVNSVLLDTDPEDSSQRLLVATTVSQNSNGSSLTLYNTSIMPCLPGMTALIVLIFTPYMELRRSTFGAYYTGALCGLGFNASSKKSLFPEHDIELHFDTEITLDDLQCINRLRHWMNIGMQINHELGSSVNMEETIICQNRIKDALLRLMEKDRKTQTPELINDFDKWNLYDESLLLHPDNISVVTNNIYKLHSALELDGSNDLQEIADHVQSLRALAAGDPWNSENTNINCKLCKVTVGDIFELRSHLYTIKHRKNEEILQIKL